MQLVLSALSSPRFFWVFLSRSDTIWKDVTHTLTLPSVILPSSSGFLHTPDGGHPAPSLNRHSPPVLSAPQAGHWGGSAHPPGAHSHCAGKATTICPKERLAHAHPHPSTTNNAISLLPTRHLLFFPLVCNTHPTPPSLRHVKPFRSSFYNASLFLIFPFYTSSLVMLETAIGSCFFLGYLKE